MRTFTARMRSTSPGTTAACSTASTSTPPTGSISGGVETLLCGIKVLYISWLQGVLPGERRCARTPAGLVPHLSVCLLPAPCSCLRGSPPQSSARVKPVPQETRQQACPNILLSQLFRLPLPHQCQVCPRCQVLVGSPGQTILRYVMVVVYVCEADL